MPFTLRPYRRFSVCCPVTYQAGLRESHGIVWNLSVNGLRLSGDVPLRVGQTCSVTINLPNQESLVVATAIGRWARGQEYGLETLAVDKETQSQVEHIIQHLEQMALESIE